jgi:hypothetical protein
MQTLLEHAMQILLQIDVMVVMVCIARILERRWPIASTPLSEVIDDFKVVSVNVA